MGSWCCSCSDDQKISYNNDDAHSPEEVMGLLPYGEPLSYDRSFKGPLKKRSCTDVPCLLIFILFLAAWGFIANYAFRNGDLDKIIAPTDSFNQKCGIDSQVLDKKYLFFFNLEKCIDPLVPITGCPTPQVCVSKCPSQTFIWDTMKDTLSMEELMDRLICQTDEDKIRITTKQEAQIAINENRCARWYVKSAPFLKRCMWEFSPTLCEFIPSFLLPRNKRELHSLTPSAAADHQNISNSDLILSASQSGISDHLYGSEFAPSSWPLVTTKEEQNRKNSKSQIGGGSDNNDEPSVQCRTRSKLGEEIIKEKMKKTDTRLARLITNFVAHFYDGPEAQQIGEKVVEDVVSTWNVIFLALVFTMVISLIFIALMRWIASPILWFSILGVHVGLGLGIYYSIQQYKFWKNNPSVPNHSINLNSAVKNVFQQQNTWLYLTIALCIALVVIFLLIVVLRKRIVIAIALIREGSKAVSCVISTVFFPIFSWVFFIATIAFGVSVGLYLASIGEPAFKMIKPLDASGKVPSEACICDGQAAGYALGKRCDPVVFQENCFLQNADTRVQQFFHQRVPCSHTGCYFEKIDNPPIVTYYLAYNIVGFFWLMFFIAAFTDMVLAATFASWYWTFHKSEVPYFVLTRAFGQTIRYHLGTLAFGSLILTICRIIRIILEYIDAKLRKYDNSVTRAILCCLKCFFWCLESFLRFLNRNAYIMCAIHGKNFCESAKDSFNLLMRNFLRVITLDKVTDFLFFLSKVLLTGAAGVATYYYIVNNPNDYQIHYNSVPTIIVVVATYLITSVFFGVYSMAVDTLFLCFLEDCERNDGTAERPYFMSKQLMRILGKRNQMPKEVNSN